MRKISIKGVLIGGVVDVVTSTVLGLLLAIYAVARVNLAHLPQDQVAAARDTAMQNTGLNYWLGLLVGLVCSALGGYISAFLARHDELLNGTLSAWLCTAIGVLVIISGKFSGLLSEQVLLFLASPVSAFLGGYFRLRQKRSRLQST